MSLQIPITAYLDSTELRTEQAILIAKNEEIARATEENEIRTKEAFDNSLRAMRASYQMIGGIAQIMGGSMGAIFSAIYGVGFAAITMYQAIAAAQFFIPGMQIQSALMVMSLITALTSLGGVMLGQTKLSRNVSNLNQSLVGISGMISTFSI